MPKGKLVNMPRQAPVKRGRPAKAVTASDEGEAAVKAVKKHRNRPDLAHFGEEYVEPGDNARYLRRSLAAFDLPPIDIADEKQVEQRIREYFDYCISNDMKPNIKGLGNWIGASQETVMNWRKGLYRSDTHFGLINRAISVLEDLWWQYGLDGKVNPANWIFIGKNAFQMKDVQDVVLTPNNPLGNEISPDAIAAKYEALPD